MRQDLKFCEKCYYDGSLKYTLKKREIKVTKVTEDLRIVSRSMLWWLVPILIEEKKKAEGEKENKSKKVTSK